MPEAVFMESLTIISKSERRKKLEVKGGFYSKDDMKNELGYAQTHSSIKSKAQIGFVALQCPASLPKPRSRIDKVVAWATKKGLYRPLCRQ